MPLEFVSNKALSVVSSFLRLARYDREKLIPGYIGKFVIQSHLARKAGHHFDLRLEFPVTSVHEALKAYEGKRLPGTPEPLKQFSDKPGTVYRSFAVKKHKLPTESTKLFIVETENHPIQYGSFQGIIPEGYGAGEVNIYDRGTFELIDVEGDKKYTIDFHGKKLNGTYALVKYQGGYLWVKTKERAKQAHDFSCVLCPLPWKITEEIKQWSKNNIPDSDLTGKGREESIHVTIKYGIHGHDPFELRPLLQNYGPIKIVLGKISIFKNENEDVVKIGVVSPDLVQLNSTISVQFENTDTHPEYVPHITLAYVKPGIGKKYEGNNTFEGKEVILNTAEFSGNDNRETSFSMINASAIDYPRPTLPKDVWDITVEPPKLKDPVKKKLLGVLDKCMVNNGFKDYQKWIENIFISGSSTGHCYQEDGDLDIDIQFNFDKIRKLYLGLKDFSDLEILNKISDALKTVRNRVIAPNSKRTYSFMLVPHGDFPGSDGIYDVLADRWLKGPVTIPEGFDPDKAFEKQKRDAFAIIKRAYSIIVGIRCLLKDLSRVDQYIKKYDQLSGRRIIILNHVKELCDELVQLKREIWSLQTDSKKGINISYPAFNFSTDWSDKYVIFKYIARYQAHEPVQLLYFEIQDLPYLDMIKKLMPADAIGRPIDY